MKASHYILATAGHVDHGKSALVHALTGTDPDRLPEEKARGITIDLGFAFLPLDTATARYEVGIIDVPGHEDFVKNMMAGMGAIDAALLVAAADDGWMPQTQEHLEILNYLGVRHGVVAITKSDLGRADSLAADIARRLRGTSLEGAAIVETAAKAGTGLAELRIALAAMLGRTPPPPDIGKPRLSVDRIFSLRGVGTVATGTLSGGAITRGQSLYVQPSGKLTRARALQTHNRDVTHALPGMRTAINLPDISHSALHRGDVITLPSLGTSTKTVIASLWRFNAAGAQPVSLRDGTRVHLHAGSAETGAAVRYANRAMDSADTAHPAIFRLELDEPLYVCLGDRFVLRDWSARETIGGGLIVDLAAERRWRLREAAFQQRAAHPDDPRMWVETQVQWDLACPSAQLLVQSHFSSGAIEEAVTQLVGTGSVLRKTAFVVEASWWASIRQHVIAAVDKHHRSRPQDQGIPLALLQQSVRRGTHRLPATLFDLLTSDLADAGLVTAGVHLKRADHAPSLPSELHKAGAAIRTALRAHPLDPPSRKELTQAVGARNAMEFLLTVGEVVVVSDEVVLSSEAFDAAVRQVRNHLQLHGRATVSELKTLLGSSRRIVVPLLEVLDRRKITLRQGDFRVLGRVGVGEITGAPLG